MLCGPGVVFLVSLIAWKNLDLDRDQLASYGTAHFAIVAFGLVGSR